MTPLQVVILAAGQGKRMHSDLPKVAHPLAGRALLAHVIASAQELEPQRLCIVVGHGADAVRDRVSRRPRRGRCRKNSSAPATR
jgi:bifunctional UDP-N-acetylglucosamine pyrophosphorylase/glucosamine-1-phosphate N-acetyltransferase